MPAPLGRRAASRTAAAAASTPRRRAPSGSRGQRSGATAPSRGFASAAGAAGRPERSSTPACASSRRNGLGPRGAFCVDHHDPESRSSERVRVSATYASRRSSSAWRARFSSANAETASSNSAWLCTPRHCSSGSSSRSPLNSFGNSPNASHPFADRGFDGSSASTRRGIATTSHSRPFDPWIDSTCTAPGSGSSCRGASRSRCSASVSQARKAPRVGCSETSTNPDRRSSNASRLGPPRRCSAFAATSMSRSSSCCTRLTKSTSPRPARRRRDCSCAPARRIRARPVSVNDARAEWVSGAVSRKSSASTIDGDSSGAIDARRP